MALASGPRFPKSPLGGLGRTESVLEREAFRAIDQERRASEAQRLEAMPFRYQRSARDIEADIAWHEAQNLDAKLIRLFGPIR